MTAVATASAACLASRTAAGQVLLENEFLRAVFDPEDGAGLASLWHKPTGTELAVCASYGNAHFKACRESLHVQPMREGRIEPPKGAPYDVRELGADASAAAVTFSGYPLAAGTRLPPELAAYRRIRIDKSYRLCRGASRLRVELTVVNEGDTTLPVGLWLLHGLHLPEQTADLYAPTPDGILTADYPWPMERASSFVIAPELAGPWTAAIGRGSGRPGITVAGNVGDVESVYDWLGKFNGFTLGFGTPLFEVAPGAPLKLDYALLLTQGLEGITQASPALACHVDASEQRVRVGLASAHPGVAALTVSLRRLADGPELVLGREELGLAAGTAAWSRDYTPALTPGVWLLGAEVCVDGGPPLRAEHLLRVGDDRSPFRLPRVPLRGRPHWGPQLGEAPLAEAQRVCDRTVRYPMIPWVVPTAGRRVRIFFVGDVGYNLGIVRELAWRVDADWDAVPFYGRDDMGSAGAYRQTEQDEVLGQLARHTPDCLCLVGLRLNCLRPEFQTRVMDLVAAGMHLVVIGGSTQLRGQEFVTRHPAVCEVPGGYREPCGQLFAAGVAPGPPGHVQTFTLDRSRILVFAKDLDGAVYEEWHRVSARNDLLPRYRGRTRLPDWEYHFAQYVRALRWATGTETAVAILELSLQADGVRLRYSAERAQTVLCHLQIIHTELPEMLETEVGVRLEAGEHTVAVAVPGLPAGDYVVHAWLLEGERPASRCSPTGSLEGERTREPITTAVAARRAPSTLERPAYPCALTSEPEWRWLNLAYLCRPAAAAPVLDFGTAAATLAGAIADIAVAAVLPDQAVPGSITVRLAAAAAAAPLSLTVTCEVRNGDDERIVWRAAVPGQGGESLVFRPSGYTGVARDSLLRIAVAVNGRITALRGCRWRAATLLDVPCDDMSFLVASGSDDDWYGTRMVRPWAEGEAMIDFTPVVYGYESAVTFPWSRGAGNTLSPPIVDETPLRANLGAAMRRSYAREHTGFLAQCDEFRLGGEFDFAPETLARFRSHLGETYADVTALNAQWGTAFASFAAVMPELLAAVRAHTDNLSAWLDFRLFMDRLVSRRNEVATEIGAEIDPRLRVGESGMYAPAWDVGMNYHLLGQTCRYLMSYGGIRFDWVRALARPDALVGVWLGYGWQNPRLPWEYLLRGSHVIGWWGYMPRKVFPTMAAIRFDLTATRSYREVGVQQVEIRRGIGRLLLTAERAPARVLIPYSQASAYTANVLERSYESASGALVEVLTRLHLAYDFVADEVAAERLPRVAGALVLLAETTALPITAAAAYARAVEQGACLLADAESGTRDGHGRRLADGAIDQILGVDRAAATTVNAPAAEPVSWLPAAPAALREAPLRLARALAGVVPRDARTWAVFADGTPAVTARRRRGGGLALWVNTRIEAAVTREGLRSVNPEDRPDELQPAGALVLLVAYAAAAARIRPPLTVQPAAARPVMLREFRHGAQRYFGLRVEATGPVVLQFPRRAHTYDVRAGRYLGWARSLSTQWAAGDLCRIYAQLPYRVTGLELTATVEVGPEPASQERRVRVSGRVRVHRGQPGRHVIHCELRSPEGVSPRFHQCSLEAPGGQFAIVFPLALSDVPGAWEVRAADIVSGAAAIAPVIVNPLAPPRT